MAKKKHIPHPRTSQEKCTKKRPKKCFKNDRISAKTDQRRKKVISGHPWTVAHPPQKCTLLTFKFLNSNRPTPTLGGGRPSGRRVALKGKKTACPSRTALGLEGFPRWVGSQIVGVAPLPQGCLAAVGVKTGPLSARRFVGPLLLNFFLFPFFIAPLFLKRLFLKPFPC